MGTLNQQVGRVHPQQIYMLHALNLMGFKRVRRKGAGLVWSGSLCNKQSLAKKINDSIEVQ